MPVTTGFDTPGDPRANSSPPRVTVNESEAPSRSRTRPSVTEGMRTSRNKGARFLGEFLRLAGLGAAVAGGANLVAPELYGEIDERIGGILPGGADNPYLSNPLRNLYPNAQGETQTSQPNGAGSDNPPGLGPAYEEPGDNPLIPAVDPGISDEESTQILPTVSQAQGEVGNLRGDLASILRDAMDPERRQTMIDQDLAATKEINAINQRYAMEKGREVTRRQVIDAWRSVTNEQIKRDAVLGSSMLQAAYLSATPNANVLGALAGPTQQAMTAFKPGSPVN